MKRQISIVVQKWPLKKPFIISRNSRTETSTIVVTIQQGPHRGLGECVPNIRYGETVETTMDQLKAIEQKLAAGLDRLELNKIMPAGAARNAIDCALWDLEAKNLEQDVGYTSGLGWPADIQTVQTISILTPQKMQDEAKSLARFPVIKVKMNAEQIFERMKAVHTGAPHSKFLIDANESWTIELLEQVTPQLAALNVQMIEQPLHADNDEALCHLRSKLPIFADESCHTSADLEQLTDKYQGINIKLDKTGGLTEAIALEEAAHRHGFQIMVGCMLSSSLGIAPAMFVTNRADYIDIDAPALLGKDHPHGIAITDGIASKLDHRLWGGA